MFRAHPFQCGGAVPVPPRGPGWWELPGHRLPVTRAEGRGHGAPRSGPYTSTVPQHCRSHGTSQIESHAWLRRGRGAQTYPAGGGASQSVDGVHFAKGCLCDSPCHGPPRGDACFLSCQLCLCHSDTLGAKPRGTSPDARTSGLFQQSGQPLSEQGPKPEAVCRSFATAETVMWCHLMPVPRDCCGFWNSWVKGLGLGLSGGGLD